MSDVNLRALAESRGVLLLMSRLLGKEIDHALYRVLLPAGTGPFAACLIDEKTRAMGEEEALESLAAEYCRLFVGPRPVCPPYESVHRGEAAIGGRAEHRIKLFMTRHRLGSSVPAGYPLLAYDHLAIGLALLHHLLEVSAEPSSGGPARERAEEAARGLLDDHLLSWAPSFLQDLHNAARLAPYAQVADLTARLLLGR